jgi:hypothetical protein
MAGKEFTTKGGEGQENLRRNNLLCEQERAQEAADQKKIEENTCSEDLVDLLDQSTWRLDCFLKLIDHEEYDEVIEVLRPLVDKVKEDLAKIGAAITGSLGSISICDGRAALQLKKESNGGAGATHLQ